MNCLFRRQGNLLSQSAFAIVMCSGLTFTNLVWSQAHPMVPGAIPYQAVYAPAMMPANYAHPPGYCPCPADIAPAPDGQYNVPLTPAPIDEEEGDATDTGSEAISSEDLPEVANISGDSGFASAPQSAVPNAIGDSFGPCGALFVDSALNTYGIDICPAGGRGFRATQNNSAVPTSRFIYNQYYFHNAVAADLDPTPRRYEAQRYELGYEYAFYCDLISMQLNVPLVKTIDSTIVQDDFATLPREAELGNVSLAFKAVIYQNCYNTLSVGLGVDAPTADDVIIRDSDTQFFLNNETIVLSPFVGWVSELSPNVFTQGFVQIGMPMNDSTARVDFLLDANRQFLEVRELRHLYIDLSLGAWLYRDQCTGNGIAMLGELHYTTALSNPESIAVAGPNSQTVTFDYPRRDVLNATVGVTTHVNAWQTTFAYVAPVKDEEDRLFDGELVFQVNRRF